MKNKEKAYINERHFQAGSSVRIEIDDKKKVNSVVYQKEKDTIIVSAFGYNLPGMVYKLYYIDKKRRDAIFVYEAVSESVLIFEGLQAIRMRVLSEPFKIQRRDYFRVAYHSKALIAIKKYELKSPEVTIKNAVADQKRYHWEKTEATIVDISAGGMKIKTDSALERGTMVQGLFEAEEESVSFGGVVARCEQSGNEFYIGIKYTDLSKEVQQKIVSLVFAIERKRLRVK